MLMATSALPLRIGLNMISLPITSISALFSGAIILLLTLRVSRIRRQEGIGIGDRNHRPLTKAIRGHANATEQLPIALILMALAELQGAATLPLAICAVLLIMGRTLHGAYFAYDGLHWQLRLVGMTLTLVAQAALFATLLLALIT